MMTVNDYDVIRDGGFRCCGVWANSDTAGNATKLRRFGSLAFCSRYFVLGS